MQNNNSCGTYDIYGTFTGKVTENFGKVTENFGNSQSMYVSLDKIAIQNKQSGQCDPYDSNNPYDKCFLNSKLDNDSCNLKLIS